MQGNPWVSCWVSILTAMVLVLWIRILPFSLPATQDAAETMTRSRIRDRVAQQVSRPLSLSQWKAEVEGRARAWIAQNATRFAEARDALAARFRADLSYEDANHRTFPYLGDRDSYTWLRKARSYIRTGTICDAIVNGECRDAYAMAPVGTRMIYDLSLHVAAIVGLHTVLVQVFGPDYPLPASAMLVPVLLGVLGVVPAFFVGRRLAGTFGGLCTALLSALHPTLLTRSIGSDNDVWNVVLPLFMMWAALAALGAARTSRRIVYALLAGVFAGLHATTWSGWRFTYGVLLCGLLGALFLHILLFTIRTRTGRVWQSSEVRAAACVSLVFYLATGLSTILAGNTQSPFAVPVAVLQSFMEGKRAGDSRSLPSKDLWPSALETVSELRPTNLAGIADSVGGAAFFCGGLAGVLVLLFSLFSRTATNSGGQSAALIVILWFLGGFYIAHQGLRFLLLFGPPFAIAFAVAAGQLYTWGNSWGQRLRPRHRLLVSALLGTCGVVLLLWPIQRGYAVATAYVPLINDAWWSTLTHFRDRTAPDAIVNTAWPYGHWVKYVAERRVSADGSSLRTRVPYWFDKVLVTPSERESVGLLRMLNCGSDATPFPEGRHGAYEKVHAKVQDVPKTHTIVVALASLDLSQAAAYLTERGFSTSERQDILRSTHCVPPETYLLISSLQESQKAWLRHGLWDFSRAYIARWAVLLPVDQAVADLDMRFGYTVQKATRLLSEARALKDDFIVPPSAYSAPYSVPRWIACSPPGDSAIVHCRLNIVNSQTGLVLQEFMYDRKTPQNSGLRFHAADGDPLTGATEGRPGALVVADAHGMTDITVSEPTYADVGVLIDTLQQRVLVGAPAFVRSTFAHLLYLDGRYATRYEKINEQTVSLGERVVTWRVHWEGDEAGKRN